MTEFSSRFRSREVHSVMGAQRLAIAKSCYIDSSSKICDKSCKYIWISIRIFLGIHATPPSLGPTSTASVVPQTNALIDNFYNCHLLRISSSDFSLKQGLGKTLSLQYK